MLLLPRRVRTVAGGVWMALGVCAAGVGGMAQAQPGIYSCVDGIGRKITADRPIVECRDRSQREISPSGTVKRVLGPTLSAQEQAVQAHKDKQLADLRAREAEEKRRDRALLLRYPSQAVHDKERAEAMAQVDVGGKAYDRRATELAKQRLAMTAELEFYAADPSRVPVALKRRIEENEQNVAVQQRLLAEQEAEKNRVKLRFEQELVKLIPLWGMAVAPTETAPAAFNK